MYGKWAIYFPKINVPMVGYASGKSNESLDLVKNKNLFPLEIIIVQILSI